MTIRIRPEVEAIGNWMIKLRRHFHHHPELGFQEVETARRVAEELSLLGLDVTTGVGETGVVGVLRSGEGPCIALRADMDGLPIAETGDVPYRSANPGVMHACGHDGHVAMLLAAARVLAGRRETLRGTVKFLFQPAEEGNGGARQLIAAGVLENPTVDEVYGIHLWNYQATGTVGVKEGPILAAADRFTLTVFGRGGHGAVPHTTVDAVVAAAHLVTALQTIVSRNTNPLESAVVTIGTVSGGYNFNVIADRVVMTGTARAYTEEVRQMVRRRIAEISGGVAQTFGAEIVVDYEDGYPPTVNDPAASGRVKAAARKIVGDGVQFPFLSMGGEDFSYYLQEVPGCFFFVGSSPEGKPPGSVPHHCSTFDIDERALLVGASVFLQLVEERIGAGRGEN